MNTAVRSGVMGGMELEEPAFAYLLLMIVWADP